MNIRNKCSAENKDQGVCWSRRQQRRDIHHDSQNHSLDIEPVIPAPTNCYVHENKSNLLIGLHPTKLAGEEHRQGQGALKEFLFLDDFNLVILITLLYAQ